MSEADDIAADLAQVPQQADAETPGQPGAAVVELPDQKTTSYSSSRIKPTAAELEAQKGVAAAADDQVKAAEELGTATAGEMEGRALAAEDRGAQGRINEVDAEAQQRAQDAAMTKAMQVADQADREVKGYKFHDFWSDKSAADRFLTGLFASVGVWGGGANPGMEILTKRIDMDFARQRAQLMTQEKFAEAKHQGVKDLSGWFAQQNYMLKLKQAAALNAAADEAEAAQIRMGIPKAQAQAHVSVATARTAAQQMKLKSTERYATTVHSATSKVEGRAVLDRSAGKQQEKQDERTVFVDGKPFGLAPTPRSVTPYQNRAVQYSDAIQSLEALRSKLNDSPITGRIPTGDEYHRAVLAIAATTQANASDTTTKHEAMTLKNSLGALSPEAIDRAIDHLRNRQREFLGNLQPIQGIAKPQENPAGAKPRRSLDDIAKEHGVR